MCVRHRGVSVIAPGAKDCVRVRGNMLIIVRGIPGSGKSTLARMIQASTPNSVMVEADDYFMTPAGYVFDGTKLRQAHTHCQSRAKAGLGAGMTVIVSNTFTQRWEYQHYLDLAEEHQVPVQVIEVHGNFPNAHGVPAEKITAMRARWEPHR